MTSTSMLESNQPNVVPWYRRYPPANNKAKHKLTAVTFAACSYPLGLYATRNISDPASLVFIWVSCILTISSFLFWSGCLRWDSRGELDKRVGPCTIWLLFVMTLRYFTKSQWFRDFLPVFWAAATVIVFCKPEDISPQTEHRLLPTVPSSQNEPNSDRLGVKLPSEIRPTNQLNITRHEASIDGVFVIDPSLPKFESEGSLAIDHFTKDNLSMSSLLGSIDVELWLTEDNRSPAVRTQTTLRLDAPKGDITVKINASGNSAPFTLMTACGSTGSTNIQLPPSFQGIVRAHGAVQFSGSILERVRMMEDTDDRKSWYVGDGTFRRDEVSTKDRRVNIKYVDE